MNRSQGDCADQVDNSPNPIQDEQGNGNGLRGPEIVQPRQELVDDLYSERVRRARVTAPEQKLLDGFRLFDFACRLMLDRIRNKNPGADDCRIQEILA
jgi:hypothetical protein